MQVFSNLSFKITSEFQENQILQKRYHNEYLEHIEYLDKPTIIHELHELYLGEWDLEYSPEKYGILIEDGDQWSIDIHYDYDELLHFEGMNAYPYNFESFLECFHIEI